ncbi:MAG TPA: hypothetical protein VGU68_16035 [Ktedonobacteraceae bacterium]|nr:hypothetical protein [Ktedonobacteraceae bacterium]
MPTLTSTDDERLTPRSTLRHRPIAADTHQEEPPRVRRATRTQAPQPAATTTAPTDIPAWKPATRLRPRKQQSIPMVAVGIGMVIAVIVVFLGQLVIGWIGTTWNDLHYGYPRTFQIDTVVGQGDSKVHPSHFLALNLKGQIEVIDLPAGDAARAKIYLGPHLYGPNADLVPVTLLFVDTRHTHQPDMVMQCQGQQIVFRNAQGSFHAPPAGP